MRTIRAVAGLVAALASWSSSASAQYFAFTPNYLDDTVSVIDTSTNTVIDTIPQVGHLPGAVAVNPSRGTLYVSDFGGLDAPEYHLSLLGAVPPTLITQVPLPGVTPLDVAVNAAGTFAYVAYQGYSPVTAIDTVTNTVSWTVQAPGFGNLAVRPDGTRLYVSSVAGVTVIDTATHAVVTDVSAGVEGAVAVNPAGTEVWVGGNLNGPTGSVAVISTATNQVVRNIVVQRDPGRAAFDPTGAYAYIPVSTTSFTGPPYATTGGLAVVDTSSRSVVASILFDPPYYHPGAAVVDPIGKYVYVTAPFSNLVYVVDTATRSIAKTITVGSSPQGIAIYAPTSTCPPGVVRTKPDSAFTIDAGTQVVTDSTTGLVWKQCSEGQSGAACSGTASTMTWAEALTAAANSSFAGHSDWRLPNEKELESLFEPSCQSPKINRTVFPATASAPYWTSTTYTYYPAEAWYLNFGESVNLNYPDYKTNPKAVRFVRGGRPMDSFDAKADSTPNGFSFNAQSGVPRAATVTSNTVTLGGFTTAASITISGGLYSVNGGTFTTSPGTVVSGDTVAIRQTGSGSASTTTTATLTVNGVHADFAVTTGSALVAQGIFADGFEIGNPNLWSSHQP